MSRGEEASADAPQNQLGDGSGGGGVRRLTK
jgi:hypothetical protein